MGEELDAILVPISGGGMAAGVALATAHASPNTLVFNVEPHGKDLSASLGAGRPLWPPGAATLETIADGMRTPALGDKPWPIIAELTQPTALPVTDAEVRFAMRMLMERAKV